MLEVLQTKIAMDNLNQRTQSWAKAVGISLPQALVKQGGALKYELMEGGPPRNLARSKKQAAKDAKKTFFPKPLDTFKGRQAQGDGMIWLYAGQKGGRFLVGVKPEDFKPNLTDDQMKAEHLKPFRGAAWHEIGKRQTKDKGNPFHVMRLNRTVVNRGRFKKFIKKLQDNFGKLKASWAVHMMHFKHHRPIPQWIMKHINSGKARGYTVMKLAGPKPFIQIISRASGVEHKNSIKNVRRAVKKRAGAMLADIRLYLNGIKKKAGFKHA